MNMTNIIQNANYSYSYLSISIVLINRSVLSGGVTNLFRSNHSHNKIVATVNPTFVTEYIKLEGGRVVSNTLNYDFDYHEKHRRLKKYTHVATLNGNAKDAYEFWMQYSSSDSPLEVTVVDLKGQVHTGYAEPGAISTILEVVVIMAKDQAKINVIFMITSRKLATQVLLTK